MPPDQAARLALLLEDPGKAGELPLEHAAALLIELAPLQAALVARLSAPAPVVPASRADADRLLLPREAAERLGVTVRWLYDHAARLPFARRLSRKVLRFSEVGLGNWLARKKG